MELKLGRICAAIGAFALASQANAQNVLLTNADVLDVRTGTIAVDQVIRVVDGKIDNISESGPRNTSKWEVVDLQGKTLLPGLSDSHVHITSRSDVHGYRGLTVTTPRSAIDGVVNAKTTLMAGFTTIRNLGAGGYADVDLRDAINDGTVPGPRLLVSGPALGITGGHCDSNLLPFAYRQKAEGVADGPWEVRQKVRQNNKYGVDVIKFCGTGGVLSKGTKIGAQQYTLEEMSALVDEAHQLGLKVAVHAHGTQGIQTALKAGVDSVEHSSLINDDSIQMAIDNGVFLSMDVYVSDYILSEGEKIGILEESLAKERQVGRLQRERFKAAVEAGAKIAFGTDAGVYPHGTNARQFKNMVEWGMTPLQAIQAATINNAELFGLADEIGAVETGKAADLIAVDGNPLENVGLLTSVSFVMKGGKVYKHD